MSYTKQLIGDLREAGLVDGFGNRLYPNLSGAGDRQPTQGANGDRVNPSDVLGELRFQERKATMNEQPVALWYKGRAYHSHPGWRRYYKEVAIDNGDYKKAPVENDQKVMRWLTNHGYRKIWQGPMKGEDCDFAECWMHVRYSGDGSDPQDFHPKSTAEIREYISLALKTDEPETVAPELPTEEATVQPDHVESIVDKVAGWIGIYFDAKQAGWLA